ncbi:MAG: aminopeptidase [Flavobacteriales bacterium]|jgi:bleomycin hydrolase|nr:aminopeptidase [Flavobacteriales bacterium]|tara:strand:+ start:21038 stop:22096 length:1059 start_codon:yes stop_codon:yes gene_type:complete
MKSIIILIIIFFLSFANAQDSLTFTNIISLSVNNVKSQGKTGTCWSYATGSFLESELIRMGKGEYNLSEMFVARNVYLEKANNFVRRHGKTNFGEGSLSHDLINTIDKYGLVPNSVFNGLVNNVAKHDHSELSSLLEAYLTVIVKQKKPSNFWKDGYSAILDVYLGEVPKSFTYNGKNYTPVSFAQELGLEPNDYINLTSFTHHKFYQEFILEVPDNWSNGTFYNIPIEKLLNITKKALEKGFTVAWDTDVSNEGFDSKKGIAVEEIKITQDLRQAKFDNYTVTDDHLMHITGLVEGSDGETYFLVKNSWGDNRGLDGYKGYVLASENYFMLNTISIMLHQDALSRKDYNPR